MPNVEAVVANLLRMQNAALNHLPRLFKSGFVRLFRSSGFADEDGVRVAAWKRQDWPWGSFVVGKACTTKLICEAIAGNSGLEPLPGNGTSRVNHM